MGYTNYYGNDRQAGEPMTPSPLTGVPEESPATALARSWVQPFLLRGNGKIDSRIAGGTESSAADHETQARGLVMRILCGTIPIFCVSVAVYAQTPNATLRTWDVEGAKREALVFAPSKKSEGKVPLVFDFHGHGGTAKHAARTHHLHETWPAAVVVYMQGLPTPGKLTDPEGKRPGWQSGPGDQKDRDLKFFDAVLASMKKDFPVDDRRIYASGHSNGGAFTYLLWAKRGDTFAAFAPVAAAAGLYFLEAKPKPAFHAGSEKDPLVKFAMQQRTLDRVKKLNGCDAQADEWAKGCRRHASKSGTPLIIYLHDQGHSYPETTPALIVKFFQEHAKK
jgi:polyhydroxybutyrate depolymerase